MEGNHIAPKIEVASVARQGPGAALGFSAQFWVVTDLLFGCIDDVAEYKEVVLGLIFLKYISDRFEEQHARLVAEQAQGADPENPAEYYARGIFWVPPGARWPYLVTHAKQPTIGRLVDDAIAAVERDNPALEGVLPRGCIRAALKRSPPGKLIDFISSISSADEESRSKHLAATGYEAFLTQFAKAEGKRGGELITPRCVVKLLVEMIEPYRGRIYDPCCGYGGMLAQVAEFSDAHGMQDGSNGIASADISIYGQESNHPVWQLAKMNLAIRGLDGQIIHGDTFYDDRHPGFEADFIFAAPPFNASNWGRDRLKGDNLWQYGVPPTNCANFAWVQHILRRLSPVGVAGIVLAEGSMSSSQVSERKIREALVEAGVVDCVVALPGQLFYSTPAPACLWIVARDRGNGKFRDRRAEILFIDAGELGQMIDRTHRELTDENIAGIADTYHAWRAKEGSAEYKDVSGFCKSVKLEEIRSQGHVLTPDRYAGLAPA